MTTMAAIYEVDGKFRARLLFDNNMVPVECLYQSINRDDLFQYLHATYFPIDVCTQYKFQMELDHIKLFGCRTDAPSYELPYEFRLMDDDIIRMLDDVDHTLDELEKDLDAILPRTDLEHEDR